MAQAPVDQALPTKEAALFRQIVKLYEAKQYKKAVKAADQVLKKFPNHGETLAMKGLALGSLDKKEEAYDLARKGLKADLKSHVCWHVLGLLYRGDRNYREAVKCYLQALRIDKENLQILRDLALLQIQTRDIAGFLDTRYQLLQLRATNRTNWLGYAVAHALSGNHDLATSVLTAYESTGGEEGAEGEAAYEQSELVMYRAQLLREGGRAEEALQLLDSSKARIVDWVGLLEARAQLLADLGKQAEAEAAYRQLVALNPEDGTAHKGMLACMGLAPIAGAAASAEQRQAAAELYRGLLQEYPDSSVCHRSLLDFLEGEELTAQAEQFVRPYLVRGIPSLFSALKPLYRDPAQAAQLGALFTSYRTTLEAGKPLPPLPGATASDTPAEGPEVLVWVLAYLGQHYSELHDTAAALEALDAAAALEGLEGPPPLELHTFRSKVLRRAGDLQGAAAAAEAAREMDLADRYVNSLSVRALFEAGRIQDAETTAALFTRDTERQGAGLRDMQHMWYEVHCARAHMDRGAWGRALVMLREVARHFADIREDELDFHAYCLRKLTLRAYTSLLRMQDSLYSHPSYTRAARLAIDCWLVLHDRKAAAEKDAAADGAANGTSKSDAVAKVVQQVEQQRQRLESAKLSGSSKAAPAKGASGKGGGSSGSAGNKKGGNKKGSSGSSKEEEADAAAEELLASADPLEEAVQLVAMLTQHAASDAATHVAAFEVALRRGRLLKALSAAQRALAAGEPDCPDAHRCVVRLALAVAGKPAAQEVVQRVIDEGMAGLLGGKTVQQYSDEYVQRCGRTSLAHAAAAVEMQVAVDASCKAEAVKLLSEVAPSPSKQGLRDAISVHRMLTDRLQLPDAAAAFKTSCTKVFKWAAYFDGPNATPPPEPKQKQKAAAK